SRSRNDLRKVPSGSRQIPRAGRLSGPRLPSAEDRLPNAIRATAPDTNRYPSESRSVQEFEWGWHRVVGLPEFGHLPPQKAPTRNMTEHERKRKSTPIPP